MTRNTSGDIYFQCKEVVALANTDGGTLYIGVCDDGTICGVENPDDTIFAMHGKVFGGLKIALTRIWLWLQSAYF